MTPTRKTRIINSAILIVTLIAIASGLVVLTLLTSHAAAQMQDVRAQQLLARLAWVSLTLLAVTCILLLWAAMRLYRSGIFETKPHKRTPYVDAWALAGKRFQLSDDEKIPPDEDPENPAEP